MPEHVRWWEERVMGRLGQGQGGQWVRVGRSQQHVPGSYPYFASPDSPLPPLDYCMPAKETHWHWDIFHILLLSDHGETVTRGWMTWWSPFLHHITLVQHTFSMFVQSWPRNGIICCRIELKVVVRDDFADSFEHCYSHPQQKCQNWAVVRGGQVPP